MSELIATSLYGNIFANFRLDNIHVLRFRTEPSSVYNSRGDSFQKIRYFQVGYDIDFYMTPQILFGANFDLDILNTETRVKEVTVANSSFDYYENQTRAIPDARPTRELLPHNREHFSASKCDRQGQLVELQRS